MATDLQTKAIRATLTDEQLIKQYENELYDRDLSERQLISIALETYFEDQN